MTKKTRSKKDIVEEAKKFDPKKLPTDFRDCNFSWVKNAVDNKDSYATLCIGDVLVKYYKSVDYNTKASKIEIETESIGSVKVNVKYSVVYRDEHGLVYVKRWLSNSNKLSETTYCISAESNFESRWYDADPDRLESIILDSDYDPRANIQKARAAVNKSKTINQKKLVFQSRINNDTVSQFTGWLDSLKKGDTFYMSNLDGNHIEKIVFEEKKWNDQRYRSSSSGYFIFHFKRFDMKGNKLHDYSILRDNYYSFNRRGNYLFNEMPVSAKDIQ